MFFKSKKSEVPELLKMENIQTGCKADAKENVIRQVGEMLVAGGYVKPDYVDAMLERELTFSTNMGMGLALPHGVEAAKKEILHSGMAVMVFPEGTDWNGETVKVVIGIAGKGEEHLTILGNIAEKFMDGDSVEEFLKLDKNGIYQALTGKEA